jgi:glycosyltransferase involved in cell wall biosynthesis
MMIMMTMKPRKRILILSYKPIEDDARIHKYLPALYNAGYDISAFCYISSKQESLAPCEAIIYNPMVNNIKTVKLKLKKAKHQIAESKSKLMQRRGTSLYRKARELAKVAIKEMPRYALYRFAYCFHGAIRALFYYPPHLRYWFYPKRIYNVSEDFFYAVKSASHVPYDSFSLIHAHDIYTLKAASYLSEKYNIPFIQDCHEYEVGREYLSIMARGLSRKLEATYLPNCSKLITVGEKLAFKMKEDYPSAKVSVIHNTPVIKKDYVGQIIKDSIQLAENDPLIVYVGNLHPRRGLYEILASINYLPSFHFANVSRRIPEQDHKIMRAVSKNKLSSRIHLLGLRPHDEVVPFIKGSDVGIIATHVTCKNTLFSTPNKLFEMLFANVPIVYYKNMSQIHDIMSYYNIGRPIDKVSPKTIANAIQEVYENKEKYLPSEEVYAELMEKYGFASQVETLLRLYQEHAPIQQKSAA